MIKTTRRDTSPTSAGTLKRVCLALVVLLLASAALVGAGSADEVMVSSQMELNGNITSASSQRTIELAAGTYTLSTTSMAGRDLTFKGSKDVKIDMTQGFASTNDANLTFAGVTVIFKNNNDYYQGFTHTKKVVYEDCTITGLQFLYAPEVEFTNCEFENKNDYCVWTYGATDVTFTGCTFNTGGKAILVYNEENEEKTSSFVADITLINCEFNDDGTLNTDKAAVETGVADFEDPNDNESPALNTPTSNRYNIVFSDCTATGFAVNNGPNNLLGNKNSMSFEHLVGSIDGEVVTAPTRLDVSGITLTNKEYDGQDLTMTGGAVAYNYLVKPFDSTSVTINYEWLKEDSNGEYISMGTETPKDAGTYKLKATVGELSDTTSSVTISPATVTITPVALTKASGDAETLTYTNSSTVQSETPKVEGTISRSVTGEKMGTYAIDVIDNLVLVDDGVFKATNYKLALNTTPVYLTITPKVIAVDGTSDYDAKLASSENESKLNNKIAISYADKFSTGKYFIEVSLLDASGQPDSTKETTFIVTYESLGISEADAKKAEFVVLHLLSDGETEEIKAEAVAEGLKIGPTTTSPFAIGYTVKQSPPTTNGGSSSSSGSSVWLTETPTPTETPTEKPTDAVPTDIPSTQPTETPASPAFGALAALAGLGAVAVLRRR